MKLSTTLNTTGDGYWSRMSKSVPITDMDLGYVNDSNEFGELCVYFDTKKWNVKKDGLIYTDSGFLNELRRYLTSQGLPGEDVDYSEQGMQDDNYVSFDVGEKFLAAWDQKIG